MPLGKHSSVESSSTSSLLEVSWCLLCWLLFHHCYHCCSLQLHPLIKLFCQCILLFALPLPFESYQLLHMEVSLHWTIKTCIEYTLQSNPLNKSYLGTWNPMPTIEVQIESFWMETDLLYYKYKYLNWCFYPVSLQFGSLDTILQVDPHVGPTSSWFSQVADEVIQ